MSSIMFHYSARNVILQFIRKNTLGVLHYSDQVLEYTLPNVKYYLLDFCLYTWGTKNTFGLFRKYI